MSSRPPPDSPSPWHDGERAVRRSAGVEELMEPLGTRAVMQSLLRSHRSFYESLVYAVLGTVDDAGDPWATIVAGLPGFLHSPDATRLDIEARPQTGDPAGAGWTDRSPVALLGIDLATRRRFRVNGELSQCAAGGATVIVRQAFGNCPQYIHPRGVSYSRDPTAPWTGAVSVAAELSDAWRTWIRAADTFFVASYTDRQASGCRAVDASHRGGAPGFVRIEGNRLSIPDYPGNRYFNTLGNFVHVPRAGLAFVDFSNGDLLQLTGDVTLDFDAAVTASFPGAQRVWHVDVRRCVFRAGLVPLKFSGGTTPPVPTAT